MSTCQHVWGRSYNIPARFLRSAPPHSILWVLNGHPLSVLHHEHITPRPGSEGLGALCTHCRTTPSPCPRFFFPAFSTFCAATISGPESQRYLGTCRCREKPRKIGHLHPFNLPGRCPPTFPKSGCWGQVKLIVSNSGGLLPPVQTLTGSAPRLLNRKHKIQTNCSSYRNILK